MEKIDDLNPNKQHQFKQKEPSKTTTKLNQFQIDNFVQRVKEAIVTSLIKLEPFPLPNQQPKIHDQSKKKHTSHSRKHKHSNNKTPRKIINPRLPAIPGIPGVPRTFGKPPIVPIPKKINQSVNPRAPVPFQPRNKIPSNPSVIPRPAEPRPQKNIINFPKNSQIHMGPDGPVVILPNGEIIKLSPTNNKADDDIKFAELISSLGVFKYQTINETECAICLSQLQLGEEVICLPCAHHFHYNCLFDWLKKLNDQKKVPVCPTCNAKII